MSLETKKNELDASAAFSKQSVVFDELYDKNTIVTYKRERVRAHVESLIRSNATILELNAGTGQDSMYFACKGFRVHATDLSQGMLKELDQKVKSLNLSNSISSELCSFTELQHLKEKGPYDLIFSNFAGLNCTNEIEKVIDSFYPLLKPGGIVTMVVLPDFCLWETAMMLKGNFKTAFRRFNANRGRKANVEGLTFLCWYFNPSRIIKGMGSRYKLLKHEGLCTIVPPSYIEHFAEKHPRLFAFLKKSENKWKEKYPWKNIGDYYIISFRKEL